MAAPMGAGEQVTEEPQAGVMELAIDIEAYTVGRPNPTSQAVYLGHKMFFEKGAILNR